VKIQNTNVKTYTSSFLLVTHYTYEEQNINLASQTFM